MSNGAIDLGAPTEKSVPNNQHPYYRPFGHEGTPAVGKHSLVPLGRKVCEK